MLELPSSTQASGAVIEHYASLPPLAPFDQNPEPPLPPSLPQKARVAFSFSGLLTATARRLEELRGRGIEEGAVKREMSRVFQDGVVGHLCRKLEHAIASLGEYGQPLALGGVAVSGGVASNQYLRQQSVRPIPSYASALADTSGWPSP